MLGHVDCVVGMSGAIRDDAARHFAVGFYGGLGERESIAAAYQQGKAAIVLEGLQGSDLPQLKARAGVDAWQLVLAGGIPEPREAGHSGTATMTTTSEVNQRHLARLSQQIVAFAPISRTLTWISVTLAAFAAVSALVVFSGSGVSSAGVEALTLFYSLAAAFSMFAFGGRIVLKSDSKKAGLVLTVGGGCAIFMVSFWGLPEIFRSGSRDQECPQELKSALRVSTERFTTAARATCDAGGDSNAKDLWELYSQANSELIDALKVAEGNVILNNRQRHVFYVHAPAASGKTGFLDAVFWDAPSTNPSLKVTRRRGVSVDFVNLKDTFLRTGSLPDLIMLPAQKALSSLPGDPEHPQFKPVVESVLHLHGKPSVHVVDGIDEISPPAAKAVLDHIYHLLDSNLHMTIQIFVIGRSEAFVGERNRLLRRNDITMIQFQWPVYTSRAEIRL